MLEKIKINFDEKNGILFKIISFIYIYIYIYKFECGFLLIYIFFIRNSTFI